MKFTNHLLILSALLVMAFNSQAHAETYNNYSPHLCVKVGSTGIPDYTLYGVLGNKAETESLWVNCPVEDRTDLILDGWVKVVDQNFTSNVGCRLIADQGNKKPTNYTDTPDTVGSNPNLQWLVFSSLAAPGGYHAFYQCRIPPVYNGQESYIDTYMIHED